MSNNMKGAMQIANADGTTSTYMRFSARLPAFLEAFPVEAGWRVEREWRHATEFAPALLRLYEKALENRINPKDAGLPALPNGTVYVARLVNAEGREVASGSALFEVQDPAKTAGLLREHEAGETAAFQRLLAARGMGGDVLNEDEATTVGLGNGQIRETPTASAGGIPRLTVVEVQQSSERAAEQIASAPSMESSAGVAGDAAPVRKQKQTTTTPVVMAEASTPTTRQEPVVAGAGRRSPSAPRANVVLASLQRTIDQLSKKAGVESVKVSSIEEADSVLQSLGPKK